MSRYLKICAVTLLGAILAAPIGSAGAETSSSAAVAASNTQAEQSPQNELTHASKEASNQESDQTEAFRHSASVRYVAKITGLNLDQAFWLCLSLNFLIVFVVLGIMLRKTLPATFRNRNENIQRRLQEARKMGEEARQRLAEVEGRLARLDSEIAKMRGDAEAAGRMEEERILAGVEQERRRIVESTEQEIAAAGNAARRELKIYAAELAVNLAAKKIEIEPNTDKSLVREFAAQLEKDGR